MAKFKVILNYHGELHTIYTNTIRPDIAVNNAVYKLAKTLGRDLSFVRRHFWDGDRVTVQELEETE